MTPVFIFSYQGKDVKNKCVYFQTGEGKKKTAMQITSKIGSSSLSMFRKECEFDKNTKIDKILEKTEGFGSLPSTPTKRELKFVFILMNILTTPLLVIKKTKISETQNSTECQHYHKIPTEKFVLYIFNTANSSNVDLIFDKEELKLFITTTYKTPTIKLQDLDFENFFLDQEDWEIPQFNQFVKTEHILLTKDHSSKFQTKFYNDWTFILFKIKNERFVIQSSKNNK